MGLDLISVHVPKAAGTSFRHALSRAYGEDKILFDYADAPLDPKSPMNCDRERFLAAFMANRHEMLAGKLAIHGHFHVGKYDGTNARMKVTVLREPIDRAVSHYAFWTNILPRSTNSLHQFVLDNRLEILDFVKLPQIRFFYTGIFFENVDMSLFSYVGDYGNGVGLEKKMSEHVGGPFALERDNVNEGSDYRDLRLKIADEAGLMRKIRDLLADDIRFFERFADVL